MDFCGRRWFSEQSQYPEPHLFAGPIHLSTVNRTITFTLTLEGNGQCAGTFVNDQVVLQIPPYPCEQCRTRWTNMRTKAIPYGCLCGLYQSIINWTTSGILQFPSIHNPQPQLYPRSHDVGNVVVLTLDWPDARALPAMTLCGLLFMKTPLPPSAEPPAFV